MQKKDEYHAIICLDMHKYTIASSFMICRLFGNE